MIRILVFAASGLILAGCTARDEFDPWGQRGVVRPEGSATLTRVTGGNPNLPPLLPERGNVWPVDEAPRATLLNLEDQQRGIQPGQASSIPPPEAIFRQDAVEFEQGSRQIAPPPPGQVRERPAPVTPALPPVLNISPPVNDRVRTLPTGETVVQPTPGLQTFTTPGGGSGIAVPQGPNTVLIGPGGRVRQVPN